MAKNNKSADVERATTGVDAVNQLAENDASKKTRSSKSTRRPNRGRNSKGGSNRRQRSGNPTLERMTYDSPITQSSLVFPSDSASMQAFGNFITTPGQDNFLTDFNQIQTLISGRNTRAFTAGDLASRTCNAMCLSFDTYFGAVESSKSNWITQPLQMAAANLKQYVDTSFGTRTDYDAQDLMLYLMSLTDIFASIAEIKRNLRLVYTYVTDQYPQFVPMGLFALLKITDAEGNYSKGEGLLYTAKHLRSFIDELNQYIIMFNRLPIPPELLIYGYNDDLFDSIFMDSDDLQTAQLYVFRKYGYWVYDENSTDPTVGAKLKYVKPLAREHSIQEMLDGLGARIEAISALRTSSTAMLQNLFNAYGSKDSTTVPTVDINTLEPLGFRCDPNVMVMIENAVLCSPAYVNITDITVNHQNSEIHGSIETLRDHEDGGLDAQMNLTVNLPLQFHKPFTDINTDDVGWALRMHPSFVRAASEIVSGTLNIKYTADGFTGFAILRCLDVAYLTNEGDINAVYVSGRCLNLPPSAPIDNDFFKSWVRVLNMYSDFNAAPIPIVCSTTVDSDTGALRAVKVEHYLAKRDVEATYRLEDLAMHWVYLSQTLWGANINRNVTGTRTRA